MPLLHLLALAAFPALVITAALKDVTSYTIPNWISGALVLALAPASLLGGLGAGALGVMLAVGVAGLAAGVAMFALGWIGGGDAKLFAAAALWLGFPDALPYLAWTAIAGGGLAVALLWTRRLAPEGLAQGPAWVGRLLTPGGDVPYGAAIAFGALMAFPDSLLARALSAGVGA